MTDKQKIVVCGTNFGRFYIDACRQSKHLELVGILSRGSGQSELVAKDAGVDLYKDISEVPDNVDILIIAAKTLITGGKSANTVKAALKKGLSVLQEQPVHIMEFTDNKKSLLSEEDYKGLGKKNKYQGYAVNNFYRYLPAVSKFLKYANYLKKEFGFIRINASCSSQLLFPLADILNSLTGEGGDSLTVEGVSEGNVQLIVGKLGETDLILHYYNEYSEDVDASVAIFFDLKIDTPAGSLILNDPEGQLIWQSHQTYNRDLGFDSEVFKKNRPMEILFDADVSDYSDRYLRSWPKAVERSVMDFAESLNKESCIKDTVQKTKEACSIQSKITEKAKRPEKLASNYINSVSLLKLKL